MKILLVSTYGFDPHFPNRPEYLQARALARRGHDVVAYGYYIRGREGHAVRHEWLASSFAVHRCSTWGFFSPEALLRMLLADRPDIVHIHHMRNLLSFQAVTLARRLGLPAVMTTHGLLHDGDLVADRERPFEAPLRFERLLFRPRQVLRAIARGAHPRRAARNYLIHAPLRMVDGAVALSDHERELLIELGLPPGRVTVLPNAVNLEMFQQPHDGTLPYARPLILFIGQLVPRKGYDILARAMPAVVRALPEASFAVVSPNLQEEATLRELVAQGGVERHLHLLGQVSEQEKLRLLYGADVIAAPSRYEGFGIPLIEAMAAGRPVVTTDIPAGNEIVRHEQTGLLVPYADPEALAAAIVRVLRDRDLARRLGACGQQEAHERYTADRLAEQLETWYGAIRESVQRQ